MWFLAARGQTIREVPDSWFRVEERWAVSVRPGVSSTPRLRHGDGIDELRVPVTWQAGKASVITRLEW